MGVVVRNGLVVTAQGRSHLDVRCRDGRIVEVGKDLESLSMEEEVDATGQFVFPGGVDPHVHMELPVAGTVSSDDFETGTTAAIAGGTTTVIDFVHPERGQGFLEAFEERRLEAAKSVTDYGLHMAVTWWGDGTGDAMALAVREGMPSFKVYLAYKATVGLDDADVIRVLATARELGALVIVHAEHGEMIEHLRERLASEGRTAPIEHALSRPPELEGEATHRVATLAGTAGASLYVVHVTCRQSVEAILAAQRAGWDVHGETCPQYLLLDQTVYEADGFEGAAYVIAPPIRPSEHQEVLWQAITDGTLELVATDHCPFNMSQKALGIDDFRLIPGGAAGVEHRLSLLYTHGVAAGRFELERFVDLVSTQPAKRFGLYPRKGSVTVGADADLVVWDGEASATISAATDHHRCDRSIFEGFRVSGRPSVVVAAGQVRLRDGELRVERGSGRYLPRAVGAV